VEQLEEIRAKVDLRDFQVLRPQKLSLCPSVLKLELVARPPLIKRTFCTIT